LAVFLLLEKPENWGKNTTMQTTNMFYHKVVSRQGQEHIYN